jgi:outer membrane protein assembly factor BamB
MTHTVLRSSARLVLAAGGFLSALLLQLTPLGAQTSAAGGEKVDALAAPVGAAPIWERDLGERVSLAPLLQANSTVLAGENGSIRSFFMSGTALWTFSPEQKTLPLIARSYEGISYLSNAAGTFLAVNRIGREVWRVDLGKPVSFPPVIGWDSRVFIPVGSTMSCRTASGRSLWSQDLGSPLALAPVLDHAGGVVSVLQNQEFVKIHQFSSVERIRLDQIPLLIVPLKEGGQISYVLLYSGGNTEKISFNNGAAKGAKLSRSRFISLPAAPVAAADHENLFAVTLRDGRVLCIDGTGGLVRWTTNSHETTAEKGSGNVAANQAAMLFDERGIYTITTRGTSAFSAEGRRRFVLKYNSEAAGIPALSDEGLLYVCGRDNKLHAYKLDIKGRTVPRTKYYGPEPEGTYGMGNPPPSPWASDSRRYQDDQQDYMYAMIERDIRSGQLGEHEPEYVDYLMVMIGFFLNDPHYSPARPAVKPPQRVKLVKLLGLIGSRETVPFLWNIFDRDREPSIKAACAEAIGTIGIDPNGRTFVSYNFLLAANNPNRDPQILESAAASVAALCRYVGPPLAGDGIYLLRLFMNLPTTLPRTKAQIQTQVDALRREGLDMVIQ